MPRTRPPYPQEFRNQIVALARSGRPIAELAQEIEPSAETIRNWLKQADRDDGFRTDGVTTSERDEIRRLKQENRRLKQERDILSKAAAWFARETNRRSTIAGIPERSSSSS